MKNKYIIFFDGYCGLCNWSVDFLISRDKQKKFNYSPLQGDYIKTLNINIDINNLNTLYVFDGQKFLTKTQAWRLLAFELGGFWKFIAIFSKIIPTFILDFIYDIIAKYRFKLFRKRQACRSPSQKERDLFLD